MEEDTLQLYRNTGCDLVKELDEFIDFLESELCHEQLQLPLQEIAVKGLMTITGLDLEGWRKLQKEMEDFLEAEPLDLLLLKDQVEDWSLFIQKLLKFMEMIPDESTRFFEDEVREDVKPLCQTGDKLLNELLEWMQKVMEMK